VAVDATGTVYVADGLTSRVRKITTDGVVSTLVDATSASGPFDFTANGLAADAAGNLYVSSGENDKLLKLSPGGALSTLAGSSGANGGRVNGSGAAAQFLLPTGIVADGSGKLVIVDSGNDSLRQIALSSGAVTTLAGTGPTTAVLFYLPGVIAGVGTNALDGYSSGTGSGDGIGNAAAFSYPLGIASDGGGNFFVADANNATVRQVTAAGVVTTFAGEAGTMGHADGTGAQARFSAPAAIARDAAGVLYVSDYNAHVVRRIAPGGVVTTLAGTSGVAGAADGIGAAATFRYPTGIAVDAAGNVLVVDTGNATVRRITAAGVVSTLAGSAGLKGSSDGRGAAARFATPTGIAIDAAGNLFVADSGNHTVRKLTPAGAVSTVVGVAGRAAFVPGPLPGGLREPAGLAWSDGVLYVSGLNGVVAVSGMG
jgi:sugar lactone lactonase YvrE